LLSTEAGFRSETTLAALSRGTPVNVRFEGVLYNRPELLDRWTNREADQITDADLVLSGYRAEGEKFLQSIKGIFALVIDDRACGVLLGARDPLGANPLYYSNSQCGLTFGTSIDQLLSYPGVSRDLNRAVIADYLCHRWLDSEETFFAAVKRVPRGHFLKEKDGRRTVCRYWDPAQGGVEWVRNDELEQFDDHLELAVSRCLQLGPAGIFLSGGLDSVSVAAVGASSGGSLRAFSLAFPHQDCDESAVQRAVAAELKLPLELVAFENAVSDGGLIQRALSISATLSAPLQNVWLPAYLHLAYRARALGCRAILTGSGGDEWLTVTPRYAADLMKEFRLFQLYKLWRSFRLSYSLPLLAGLRNLLWSNGARPLLGSLAADILKVAASDILRHRRVASLYRDTPDWIAPDPQLQREMRDRVERKVDEDLRVPDTGWYWRDVRASLDHPLMLMEIEEIFAFGRLAGVQVLAPFWDADLVAFLYRVPPNLLNRGGRSKGLVRQMLARKFPHLGFEGQKKVTSLQFFESTVLTTGPEAWRRMESASGLGSLGIVDIRALGRAMQRAFESRSMRRAQSIWDVMNLEAWTRPRL